MPIKLLVELEASDLGMIVFQFFGRYHSCDNNLWHLHARYNTMIHPINFFALFRFLHNGLLQHQCRARYWVSFSSNYSQKIHYIYIYIYMQFEIYDSVLSTSNYLLLTMQVARMISAYKLSKFNKQNLPYKLSKSSKQNWP